MVVCDIDDTVLVTGIATPLRAAWRTFIQPMGERQAVPGMAALLWHLTSGAPHVPVVYLSNRLWNWPVRWPGSSSAAASRPARCCLPTGVPAPGR